MNRPIVGWEGLYEISPSGDVFSLERVVTRSNGTTQKFRAAQMALCVNAKGYLCVHLSRPGLRKMARVHRLVAEAYLANPHNLPEVNHKDGNKKNPNLDNLEWCTSSQNSWHAFHVLGAVSMPETGKLSLAIAQEIRAKHIPRTYGYRRIASEYSVDPSTIREIVKGRAYPAPPAKPDDTAQQEKHDARNHD